jgi:hypothetical protein
MNSDTFSVLYMKLAVLNTSKPIEFRTVREAVPALVH